MSVTVILYVSWGPHTHSESPNLPTSVTNVGKQIPLLPLMSMREIDKFTTLAL